MNTMFPYYERVRNRRELDIWPPWRRFGRQQGPCDEAEKEKSEKRVLYISALRERNDKQERGVRVGQASSKAELRSDVVMNTHSLPALTCIQFFFRLEKQRRVSTHRTYLLFILICNIRAD
jgi:hypothetical protein